MSSEAQLPPIHLVIVDDDAAFREVFALALELEGFHVVSASTAEQALEHMASAVPDALVVDLSLPGSMDGTELARRVRATAHLREVACFALTGWNPDDLPAAHTTMFRAVFRKPARIDVVAAAIRAALRVGASADER